MASLEERVRALEDERAIARTMHTYAQSIDYDLEAEFVDCWAEGAKLHWSGLRPEPFVGPAEIAEAFRSHAQPGIRRKHLAIEQRIVVEGDRATATSYFAVLEESDDGPRIRSYGCYEDVFVRCDDGRWRFHERRPEVEARR